MRLLASLRRYAQRRSMRRRAMLYLGRTIPRGWFNAYAETRADYCRRTYGTVRPAFRGISC